MWFLRRRIKKQPSYYEGFEYHAGQLSAYLYNFGFFMISLKDGDIIKYYPEDIAAFRQWLTDNKVRNVKDDSDCK